MVKHNIFQRTIFDKVEGKASLEVWLKVTLSIANCILYNCQGGAPKVENVNHGGNRPWGG